MLLSEISRLLTTGGHAVAHLVEALRYKPEGRGFDSRWCHWNFSLTYSFLPHYGPGVDSASTTLPRIFLWGEGGWCVGLTTLQFSCANCHGLLEPWHVQTCNGISLPFTLRS